MFFYRRSIGYKRPFSSSHENGNKKPPYPLPLPLSGAMGFIGGSLLIMPVMTTPANHTHYSAWTGSSIITLNVIALILPRPTLYSLV